MCPIDTSGLYEDVSTLDRPAIEALADEALTIAIQHIQAKLGGRPGDIAAHMFPHGNAAEALLSSYIEAEIDAMIEAEEPTDNFEEATRG